MTNEEAWNYAIGLLKVDWLEPSADFMELIEKEKRGEVALEQLKEYLDSKYKKTIVWRRLMRLFFEKMRYKKMLRDVLKVTYGMTHMQAKSAVRKSTVNVALKVYPEILMHDAVEDTARIVYLQYFNALMKF